MSSLELPHHISNLLCFVVHILRSLQTSVRIRVSFWDLPPSRLPRPQHPERSTAAGTQQTTYRPRHVALKETLHSTHRKSMVLKRFLKRLGGSTKNHHQLTLFHLRYLYRLYEELFKEMVPQRTLVWKVLWGTRNGALKNHVKVLWDTFIGSLKNSLKKWFFEEPWFERFFVEPEMVP